MLTVKIETQKLSLGGYKMVTFRAVNMEIGQ